MPTSRSSGQPGAVDGPYNEHLIRDVGAMFLALGVIAPGRGGHRGLVAARLAPLGRQVFSILHFAHHVSHLRGYGTLDQ